MRKVKGTLHWVSAKHALETEIRLYDRLFKHPDPGAVDNFLEEINPDSLSIIKAKVEPFLASAKPGEQFQFERVGYFTADEKLSQDSKPVFNRTVGLKDSWAKKA